MNNLGFRNAEVDRLIVKAREENDPVRRKGLYLRLDRLVNIELPVLPLYHDIACYAHRKAVGRFEMDQNFRKVSQEVHPERWVEFYDRVAVLWPRMGGKTGIPNQEIIEELLLQQVIRPGQSALDLSEAMLNLLRKQADASGIKRMKTIQTDWEVFKPKSRFHLVLAAGFPQACEPTGISRLESFSRGYCALILGNGQDPFPFRRLLWNRIMKKPLPDGKLNLFCTVNYLLVTGKNPQMRHFNRQVTLSLPMGRMVGVRGLRLIVHYLFPQLWPQVLIVAALRTGWTILMVLDWASSDWGPNRRSRSGGPCCRSPEGKEITSGQTRQWEALRGPGIFFLFQSPLAALNPTMKVGQQIGEALKEHFNLDHRSSINQAGSLLE